MKRILLCICLLIGVGKAFGQGAPAGNVLNFDGIDDYVVGSDRPVDLNTGSFTLETWIKTFSVSAGIFTYANGNTTWEAGEKCLFLDQSGNPIFVGYGKDYIITNTSVSDGKWHHIAVTYNYSSNIAAIYIDGVDRTSGGSFSIGNQPDIGTFYFGKPNYGTNEAPNYLNGSLDQFRIWNVARSAADIAANYQLARPSTTTGLVASYNFNEGIANAANPTVTKLNHGYSSNLKATLVNFALTGNTSNWVAANPNNALDFDGLIGPTQGDRVRSNSSTPFNFGTGNFTMETWIKTTYAGGNNKVVIGNVNTGNYWFGTRGGTNTANFSINGTDLTGTTPVNDNKWHHLAAIRTAGSIQLFVDGILQGTLTNNTAINPNNNLYIGDFSGDGAYSFLGQVDDVKMYSRALSTTELQNDMTGNAVVSTTNLVVNYNFNQGIAGGNNSSVTTLQDQSVNANNGTLSNFALSGATSNWVSNDNLTPTGTTASAPNNGSFTASWAAPNTTIPITGYRIDVATDAAFANIIPQYNDWDLGNLSSLTIRDLKPGTTYYYRVRAYNNLYETSANSAAASATTTILPPPGNAINFGKIDDYASMGTATSFDARMMKTIEAWVKFSNFSNQEIISKSVGSKGLELLVFGGNLSAYAMGGSDNHIDYPVSNLQLNKWYHVAVTHNGPGTLMAMYINGLPVGSTAISTPAGMLDSGFPLMLGTWAPDNSRNFSGTLDEVRIWNVQRSAADIAANMNIVIPSTTPGLSAYYNFDHGVANANNYATTRIYDQTSNEIDGFFLNATLNTTSSNWVNSYAMVVPTATGATSITNSGFVLNWTAPVYGTVATYSLDYATDAAFTTGLVTVSGINGLSRVLTNLKPGTTYYYRVYAVNGSEIGANSNVMTATTATLAPPGNSLDFSSASSNVVKVTSTGFPAGNTSYTMEAWINPRRQDGAYGIMGWGEFNYTGIKSNQTNAFRLGYEGGQYKLINYWWDNDLSVVIPDITNKWSHVAATYDPGNQTMSIYLDGNLMGTKVATGHTVTSKNIQIGQTAIGEYFEGKIDEVRVYSSLRSPAQILADMTATAPDATNLVAAYNFDHGIANQNNTGVVTLYDQSGNNNNGTLNNFSLITTTSNWSRSYAMTVPVASPASTITGNSFVANWTAPVVGTADRYYIDVATDIQFTNLLATNVNAGNALSYTVTGLSPVSVYYYRVRAYNTLLNTQGGSSGYIKVTTIKANQILTLAATASKTYGDADFNVNASSTNTGTPVITYSSSDPAVATVNASGSVHILKAGLVTITASQAGDGSYNAAVDKTQVITVATKALTITASAGQGKVYGSADPALTFTPTGLVSGDGFTGSLARAAGEHVFNYSIGIGNLSAGPNYSVTYNSSIFSITPKPVTVTADAGQGKIYGAADPTFTYSYAALAFSDTFSGALSRTAGENVGTYGITQGNLTLSSDYTLSYAGSNFNISAKPVTVTATAGQGKVYGASDPVFTYSYTPLAFSDVFSGALNRTAGEAVGSYAITQGNLSLNSNYTLSYTGDNFVVTAAPLTVTATGPAKAYGQALTTTTGAGNFTYSATQNGEVVNSVTLTPDAAGVNATTPANATYVVTPSAATGTNGFLASNYAITYVPYTGPVGLTTQTITFNSLSNATYGDAPITLTATSSSGLPVSYSSSNTAVATVSGNTLTIVGAGTATIAANQIGDTNYTPATAQTQNVIVNTKALTVTATAGQTKVYGAANPVYIYTSAGLVSGDAFSGALSRSSGENVGTTYAINQGSLTAGANYTITYNTANFSITAKPVTVTATAGQTKVYGAADPAFAYSFTPALVTGDAFTGTLSRAAGINVGTYAINQGSLALSSNYTLTFVANNFSISAKPIAVTADAKAKVYGSADPVLSYTFTPALVTGDAFTGALSRTAEENVGTYAINKNTLALSSNYTLTYTAANLSITPKALTVTADNKTRVQGTANPAFTATYTGFANGDTNAALLTQPVFATTATQASLQGTYPIVVNGATSNNYTITFVNGTLTVTPGTPTSLTLAAAQLFENRPSGTLAGTLSSTSDDPGASFTYTLVPGTGSTDNAAFSISGNQLVTGQSFDFETKNSYSVRVRTTTQYGLFLEQTFTVNVLDVNEAPTLNTIADAALCATAATQNIALTGISAGPETAQSTVLSVTSNNAALFNSLSVSGTGSTGTLSYQIKSGVSGVATITVTVQDNGGTANGGTDTFTRTFNLTIYALPTPSIASDKGDQVSKGETIKLTATGGTGYVWANANGIISGQNTATLTVRPSITTTYTVTATNANGCSQSSSFTITVLSDFAKLKITNLLTPNGDGYNDKWTVENIDLYPNNEVKVFDKAGKLVYSKKGYDNSWDGSFNGSPLAENTYYYIIDFGPNYGKLKGFVTIVRE